jgi:hypothetical protein
MGGGPFDDLIPGRGGGPPQVALLPPAQRTIATPPPSPVGRSTVPPPGARVQPVGGPVPPGQSAVSPTGEYDPSRAPPPRAGEPEFRNGIWYNPATGQPYPPSMQKYLSGQQTGGGGTTVVLAPPTPVDPNQPLVGAGEYVVGRAGDSEVVYNKELGRYFTINRKTKSRELLDPEKVGQYVKSPITQQPVTPKQASETQGKIDEAILARGKKLIETHDEQIAPFAGRSASLDYVKYLVTPKDKGGAGVSTGPGSEFFLPFNQALQSMGLLSNEKAENVSRQRAIQAIIADLVPRVRQVGSGSSSDKDMALFAKALPQLSDTPESNLMIISALQQSMRHAEALQAARVAYWQAGKDQELDTGKVDANNNPITFKKTKGQGDLDGFNNYAKAMGLDTLFYKAKPGPAGSPAQQEFETRVQEGDVFIGPDGKFYVR